MLVGVTVFGMVDAGDVMVETMVKAGITSVVVEATSVVVFVMTDVNDGEKSVVKVVVLIGAVGIDEVVVTSDDIKGVCSARDDSVRTEVTVVGELS